MDRDCFSIAEFCGRNGVSRAFLYKMWQQGIGPRRMLFGSRILITREAADEWRRKHTEGPRESEQRAVQQVDAGRGS